MDDIARALADVAEEVRALDRAAHVSEAKAFLARLDPGSQVGLWFEAFAESFPSRLEAAVEYTRLLR
jgi:hypothetical protein